MPNKKTTHAINLIKLNLTNKQLSDEEFRKLVKDILDIFELDINALTGKFPFTFPFLLGIILSVFIAPITYKLTLIFEKIIGI